MAKRKKDEEYRTFQQEWTEEFAFVERAGDSRKKACQELLSRVQASQQQLRVWTLQGDWNSASFAGALAIVRNGKPFTDGEYAKTFMLDVANELFDDFSDKDKSFKVRFGEFRERTRLFKFITHPHECAVDSTDLSYIPGVSVRDFELQAANLKASDMWVNKFKSLNEDLERLARQKAELASKRKWGEMKKLQPKDQLIDKTWNVLPVTYHTLQRVSVAVLTMFGSTYACEQSFSHLKNIKTNLRSRLTDGSLNACMKLNLTTYQPDYKAISKTMQHQKSH
ncbi:hypothetical protein MHYP_G00149590 [Metynnis hypsauchen]